MLISQAWAQGSGAGGQGFDMMGVLPIILMVVLLYFLMIRPQMKRAKEHRTLLDGLEKDDEVVTVGGVLGRITKLNENYVTLEIAHNIEVQVQRPAVQVLLPKGTIKNIQ